MATTESSQTNKSAPATLPPAPSRKELAKQLAKLEEELEELQDPEPFVKEAEEILAKMEEDMANGMQWLKTMKDTATSKLHVVSELGRPRRLFRVLTGIRKSIAEAGRRAKNAPIQGISSEVGVVAGYESYCECYRYSKREKPTAHMEKFRARYEQSSNLTYPFISRLSRLVHDAQYFSTPYPLLLPQIHIGLWTSTTGAAKYYAKHFGFTMLAPPEVELELCAREDKVYKWNWNMVELGRLIRKSLEDQQALGNLDYPVDRAMKEIFWCYLDEEEREYLYRKYPFLDVPYQDVKPQIMLMLKDQGLV